MLSLESGSPNQNYFVSPFSIKQAGVEGPGGRDLLEMFYET